MLRARAPAPPSRRRPPGADVLAPVDPGPRRGQHRAAVGRGGHRAVGWLLLQQTRDGLLDHRVDAVIGEVADEVDGRRTAGSSRPPGSDVDAGRAAPRRWST